MVQAGSALPTALPILSAPRRLVAGRFVTCRSLREKPVSSVRVARTHRSVKTEASRARARLDHPSRLSA
jgi:hypothetical protein